MKVELFQDAKGCYRWHIVADNNEILASSEAYSSKADATKTAKMLVAKTGFELVKP